MEKIKIREENKEYNVIIENNILEQLPNYIEINCNIFIICDQNIFDIYHLKIANWFKNYAFKIFCITANENNKSYQTVISITEFLLTNNCGKESVLISLGGGITGDITGFTASIYHRGIKFIQIPTTLLSMVDSSIGGKTGLNFKDIKNVVGSFYSPSLVLIDPCFLNTLDLRNMNSGYAEVIKYGFIHNKEIVHILENEELNYVKIIKTAILSKKYFVEKDFRDEDCRRILNFGHTIGHSIEREYNLLHGEAIALGMIYAVKLGIRLHITKPNLLEKLIILLNKFDLRTDLMSFNVNKYIQFDKKNTKDYLNFILIEELEKPIIKQLKLEEVYL